jgi:hypothetical protein
VSVKHDPEECHRTEKQSTQLLREEFFELNMAQAFIVGTDPSGSVLSLPALRTNAAAFGTAASVAAGVLDASADLAAIAPAQLPGMVSVGRAATELLAGSLPVARLPSAAPKSTVRQAHGSVSSVAPGAPIPLADSDPLANAGSAPAHASALSAARNGVGRLRHVSRADWARLGCPSAPRLRVELSSGVSWVGWDTARCGCGADWIRRSLPLAISTRFTNHASAARIARKRRITYS